MTENIYKAYTFDGVNFILDELQSNDTVNSYYCNTLTQEIILKTTDPDFPDDFEVLEESVIEEFMKLCEELKNKMNLREVYYFK